MVRRVGMRQLAEGFRVKPSMPPCVFSGGWSLLMRFNDVADRLNVIHTTGDGYDNQADAVVCCVF